MKGEFGDDKDPHPFSSTTPTMFSKFHHHPPPQPPPQPPHFAVTNHRFHLTQEADSRSPTTNDGASIEVVRRPRGRPPGSKNKPKPPVIITREPDPSMSPYVLEFPGGSDIVDSLTTYCRKRNTGLCVLTGSGTVTNVSLRQPSTNSGATVTFHGRFDILSISATVLPPSAAAAHFGKGFTISLSGPQGQVVGGAVAGPLIAAGTTYIIAASFNNPLYHRLPAAGEDDQMKDAGGAKEQAPDAGDAPPSTAADSMTMYSSQLPSDVIWSPTPRQAIPHPPPY